MATASKKAVTDTLRAALVLATEAGVLDDLQGYVCSPNSVNDLCDALEQYVVDISGDLRWREAPRVSAPDETP